VVLALLQRYVIAREEAYLERNFGDELPGVQGAVGRWI